MELVWDGSGWEMVVLGVGVGCLCCGCCWCELVVCCGGCVVGMGVVVCDMGCVKVVWWCVDVGCEGCVVVC